MFTKFLSLALAGSLISIVKQLKVIKYPHQLAIGLAVVGSIIGIAVILAVALRGS